MTRHKHADIIHAWADGAEIQWRENSCMAWLDVDTPCFHSRYQYRIKPKIVKREGWVNIYRAHGCEIPSAATVHATEGLAKTYAVSDGLVATVKVEWEEEE